MMSPLKVTTAAIFSRKLFSVRLEVHGLNSLRDFNGNQNSGLILMGFLFGRDAELFKPVEDETVLGKVGSGALGSEEL